MLHAWHELRGYGLRHGVDPLVFAAIYVARLPLLLVALGRTVRRLRRHSPAAAPATAFLALGLSPYAYPLAFGHGLPGWLVGLVLAAAALTAVVAVRKLLRLRGAAALDLDAGAPARAEFAALEAAAFAAHGVHPTRRTVHLAELGIDVDVKELGEGEPVLLVHGGNSVAASWAPLLGALEGDSRLILPDRPGCGLTDPFDYQGVDLRAHAVTFISGLLDAIGEERVAVVGNSMGGYFALAFALAHPDRVTRLVLLGEPANTAGEPVLLHRLIGTHGVGALLHKTILKPAADGPAARRGLTRAKLLADPARVSDELYECFAAGQRLPGASRSWTSIVEAVFEPTGHGLRGTATGATKGLEAELAHLHVPTLLLWGDADPLGSTDVASTLADRLRDAQLRIVKDAGHLPWLDQPAICATAVHDFLGRDPRPMGVLLDEQDLSRR